MQHPTMVAILAVLLLVGCTGGGPDLEARTRMYETRISQEIDEVKSALGDARAELAEAGEESREAIAARIDDLERKQTKLENALEKLARQTEESWDSFTREVDALLDDRST